MLHVVILGFRDSMLCSSLEIENVETFVKSKFEYLPDRLAELFLILLAIM